MTAGSLAPGAALRLIVFISLSTSFSVTSAVSAMTPMPTVTEHVHRDKGDECQDPKPVLCQPGHSVSPLGFSQCYRFRQVGLGLWSERIDASAKWRGKCSLGAMLMPLGPFPTGTVAMTLRSATSITDAVFA